VAFCLCYYKNVKKILLTLLFIFLPALTSASTANDFTVNNQSVYDMPPGSVRILILDLTLPAPLAGTTYQLQSINLHNIGTADHTVITKLQVWQNETKIIEVLQSPFFDTDLLGDFAPYEKDSPERRILVTVDLQSGYFDQRSLQVQALENSLVFKEAAATGPTDQAITGLKRMVMRNASVPDVPMTPLAQYGQALSDSAIRWYFIDLSNNELGFKILDANLKEVARKEAADLSYLDETGLLPDTEYSGRRIVAFNDRGEGSISASSVFPSVRTLARAPVIVPAATSTEIVPMVPAPEVTPAPTLLETIQTKITDIQRQINDLLKQINELIKQSAATVLGALQGFLRLFFGK